VPKEQNSGLFEKPIPGKPLSLKRNTHSEINNIKALISDQERISFGP